MMNEDEKSFDALRQLLALKRHETPPPGYFNGFSARVIDELRLRATPCSERAPAKSNSGALWFTKFLQLFEFKPAFAGALASAVCLLLIFGIVYADRPDSNSQPFMQGSGSSLGSLVSLTPAQTPSATYASDLVASNNAVTSLQPVAPLFDSGNALVQPVSFSPAGN